MGKGLEGGKRERTYPSREDDEDSNSAGGKNLTDSFGGSCSKSGLK